MVACIFSISFVLLIFRGLLFPVYSPCAKNKAPVRPVSAGLCQRQGDGKGSAVFAAALHGHAAAVQHGDLPHKGKAKPHAAHLPAAGLIHPEKGLEDALPAVCGDARAGICNAQHGGLLFPAAG